MQITSIQITRRDNTGTKPKATVSIVLDDMVVIHDIKVLNNAGTIFLAMPSRTTKAGTFKDIVHPINQDVRKAFERLIIGAYERAVKKNCSKLELQFSQNTSINIFEQSCDMFEVADTSAYSTHSSLTEEFSKTSSAKPKSSESKNDALLKWLES